MGKAVLKREENAQVKQLLEGTAVKAKQLDETLVNRRAAAAFGRDLLITEGFEEKLAKVFKKGYCSPPKYTGKKAKRHSRILNVIISDTHFQSLLDPAETPLGYHATQESRRLGRVAQQVSDYKRQYRQDTKLIIHFLGDIFQNQLHDARDGAVLTLQFAASVHYLTQFIMFLAGQFPTVEVDVTPGNHGRNMSRHPDRAVQQKWDSIETMVYMSVRAAIKASGLTNVTFNIGKRPYYTVQLFNNKGFFTHGDTVLKPGFPGKNINTKSLFEQICRWNSARNIGGPFNLFCVGHVHFGSITNMPGGIVMITNGCLIPPDAFSLSIGAPDVTCGQYMFESVEDHVIGDQRFIVVDGADDNPEYNKIIPAFIDLEQ